MWACFQSLSSGRTCGFGPNPIAYSEIEAWQRLYGESLRPYEVTVIKMLDGCWLKVMTRDKKEHPAQEDGN